ncbi:MAG: hypothetical protein AAF638_12135, partial [Pseudomonadota bacterium]
FQVTGLNAGETLAVKRAASAGAQTIGTLRFNAAPVEVFETRDGFGRIVFQEANGWVPLSSLAVLPIGTVIGTKLPQGLMCVGTEPFWSAEIVGTDVVHFETAEGLRITHEITASGGFEARPNADFLWLEAEANHASMSVRRTLCSDGMSDRDYPMFVDLVLRGRLAGQDSASALTGCCFRPVEEK